MTSAQFIDSVLRLQPRTAAFDCDGTLWAGDSGQDFFYWEIEEGIVPAEVARWAIPRYADYKAGKVDEETMCGEMVTINGGVEDAVLRRAARRFFDQRVSPRIFPAMQELTRRLAADGCELWAVSSTNLWVVAEGASRFGIRRERVLAASVYIEDGLATSRLIHVPTGSGKARALAAGVPTLDAAFGNSVHDLALLELARHPFLINPNPDLRTIGVSRRWPVFDPPAPA
jgi:phosphoserine phosphatase